MKRCSTLLIIREMEIKTITRSHFIPTRMAVILKKWGAGITSVVEDEERLDS